MAKKTKRTPLKTKSSKRRLSQEEVGFKYGFRSGLEEELAKALHANGVPFSFEELTINYEEPAKKRRYTPDFVLPNGIIIESKGRFVTADRQKHLLVKAQRPDLDIRFVFSNSKQRISKRSKTTYAMWCAKYGFKYADRAVPEEWLQEARKP